MTKIIRCTVEISAHDDAPYEAVQRILREGVRAIGNVAVGAALTEPVTAFFEHADVKQYKRASERKAAVVPKVRAVT